MHMAKKRHIVQYDACTFSVNKYAPKHWAPQGNPLKIPKKFYDSQLVCVLGAISVEEGVVHWHAEQVRAFKTEDTINFFNAIGVQQ